MCTVIVHVPDRNGGGDPGEPVRLLAVRDEDPGRAWDPLGPWWPGDLPGVVGVRDARAGGAWLAADPRAGRLAVILNRAELTDVDPAALGSRGHVVLDAVAGRGPAEKPRVHGFNLVEVDADGAQVTMWDGESVRTVRLAPGIHMIAHDDVDDPATPRISAWRGEFAAPSGGARWWEPWLRTLERSAELGPADDRAIVRDNRPHGYPTLSLLVTVAAVGASSVELAYGEFDEPGAWNHLELRPLGL